MVAWKCLVAPKMGARVTVRMAMGKSTLMPMSRPVARVSTGAVASTGAVDGAMPRACHQSRTSAMAPMSASTSVVTGSVSASIT